MLDAGDLGTATISFERVYDAAIEDIWALWTTKEGLEQWFGPEGMRLEVIKVEPWVGGAFDHVMRADGPEQVAYLSNLGLPLSTWTSGRFIEVERHRRLLIRFDIDFVPGADPYPYDMLVELGSDGDKVRMILTADRHPDPEMTRGAVLGLTSQLEKFAAVLAPRARKEQP